MTIAEQFRPCGECGRQYGIVEVSGGLLEPGNRTAIIKALACGIPSGALMSPKIDIEDDVAVFKGGKASAGFMMTGFGAVVVELLKKHGIAARDGSSSI